MSNELRCIHRHLEKEHPRCFDNGVPKIKKTKSSVKILLLDIETSLMSVLCWGMWEQNISIEAVVQDWHLLSWSAKWLFDEDVMSDALTSEEAKNHNDKRIAISMWDLLDKADVVITHNGNYFDLKKLNTRFIKHGMIPPRPYQSIDTLKIAKEQFNFSSNKLDYINEFLGLPKKIKTDFEMWIKCFYGDPEALHDMEVYNRGDTEVLEDLYLRFRPFIKGHPNLNLWSEDNISICPNCGSEKLNWNGHYYTYTGRYKAFRCTNCGATGRSRVLDLEKEKRATVIR
jgi:hypothetical protein